MVHLYFTFQSTEKLFFVMEYLDGGDFAEFIKLNQSIKRILYYRKFKHLNYLVLPC